GGRPLAWVVLQGLAATAATSTAILAVGWGTNRDAVPDSDRVRVAALLAGGALFVPWAAYWGLLSP
ncbi:MAG: alpha/beta hydrolase, partial [Chloroflexota bacterium]|nr:alpha/beta hydrolase [Chloroflexota bacterium]